MDGVIPLDDDGVGVVKDTLAILASKEIKLTSLRRYVYVRMYACTYVRTYVCTCIYVRMYVGMLVRSYQRKGIR